MNKMIQDIIENLERDLRSQIKYAEELKQDLYHKEEKILLLKETIAEFKGIK